MICGDITEELVTSEQILSLDDSNQQLKVKTKPETSPWKSTGSRLKFSLKDYKISWYVPIEASYTYENETAANNAPFIRSPQTNITVEVGSVRRTQTFNLGKPLDLEADSIRVSDWLVNQSRNRTDYSWISLA